MPPLSQRRCFGLRSKSRVFPQDSQTLLFSGGAAVLAIGVLLAYLSGRTPITTRPVMNKSEQRFFMVLKEIVRDALPNGYQVLSQVSFGEFLASKSKKVFWSFNAKRADFLIIDTGCNPIAVVEYQGAGHSGRTLNSRFEANKRDRVKRCVFSAANVPMIAVPGKWDSNQVLHMITQALPRGL
jgi:hypothetical protein